MTGKFMQNGNSFKPRRFGIIFISMFHVTLVISEDSLHLTVCRVHYSIPYLFLLKEHEVSKYLQPRSLCNEMENILKILRSLKNI